MSAQRMRMAAWGVAVVLAVLLPFFFGAYRVGQFTQALSLAIAVLGLNLLVGYSGQISLGHGAFFALGAYTSAITIDDLGVPYLLTLPLAGVLLAPRLFLDVNLMGGVLIYSFAAATLGGFDSPLGAVLGGWIIGVAENLAGTYVDFIGSDLKILVPLTAILVVLLFRPTGLFGSAEVARA